MIRTNKSRWLVILLLLTVGALLLPHSFITSAQKRTSPRATKPKSAKPKAAPTPTPSAVDALGAPPPVPTLRQQKREEQEVTPGDVISVNTTEVMIPVTVRDSNGRLVNDLTRSDFRVFENDSEQPLSDLALRQVPVDVVLMVDAS